MISYNNITLIGRMEDVSINADEYYLTLKIEQESEPIYNIYVELPRSFDSLVLNKGEALYISGHIGPQGTVIADKIMAGPTLVYPMNKAMTAHEDFLEHDFIREDIDYTTFIYYKHVKKNKLSAKLIIQFEDYTASAHIETAPYNGVVHRYPAMLDSDTINLISHMLHEMGNN